MSEEEPVYPDFPLVGIRHVNGKWQYQTDYKPEGEDSTFVRDDVMLDHYCTFIQSLVSLPTCPTIYAKHESKCTCLHVLRGDNIHIRFCAYAILGDCYMAESKSASDYYALRLRRQASETLKAAKELKKKTKLFYLLPQNPYVDGNHLAINLCHSILISVVTIQE